ncbi:hypothetical protein G3I43_07270 [Streptomyces anulatus]|uniref:Uncharacterized protein n=1 Tax=Streptomyces anulatus TaxID=1892 RepID=A0A6G3SNI0_STRAQ|nr:hypothetical protein [Streptomyces anulatus]NEB83978.1 hypothetical protein [Streptomyces anulatus]
MRDVSLPARLARLEEELAQLRRTGWERDELPLFPTAYSALAFSDAAVFTTLWETTFAPRTAGLALGLTAVGDQVAGVNTGGAWQVLLAGAVAWSGSVPPSFTVQYASTTLDLLPYRGVSEVLLQVQVRRTSGATTGGRTGGGGSIGLSPRYARIL